MSTKFPRKVFLSHSHEDSGFCEQIARALQDVGVGVWYDNQNLVPGEDWMTSVQQAIQEAAVFIVILSPQSIISNWVRNELSYALAQDTLRDRILAINITPAYEQNAVVWGVPEGVKMLNIPSSGNIYPHDMEVVIKNVKQRLEDDRNEPEAEMHIEKVLARLSLGKWRLSAHKEQALIDHVLECERCQIVLVSFLIVQENDNSRLGNTEIQQALKNLEDSIRNEHRPEQIPEYVDMLAFYDEATARQNNPRLAAHLDICKRCQGEVRQLCSLLEIDASRWPKTMKEEGTFLWQSEAEAPDVNGDRSLLERTVYGLSFLASSQKSERDQNNQHPTPVGISWQNPPEQIFVQQTLQAFQKGVVYLHAAQNGDKVAVRLAIAQFRACMEWITNESWPEMWFEVQEALRWAYCLADLSENR